MHTKEELTYNKALIAKSYVAMNKFRAAFELINKIEKEVTTESLYSRKTMVILSKLYTQLGHSINGNRIYHELNGGKWGLCENDLLKIIKPSLEKTEKITSFAPPPEMVEEPVIVEKKKSADELVVLAKFYLERRNSRYNAHMLLTEILSNPEENQTYRKTMLQTAKLYEKIGLTDVQKRIESDLKEGKWGPCEKQILDKLSIEEKKDLWSKTKEMVKKKLNVSPLPEFTIPSILMIKF